MNPDQTPKPQNLFQSLRRSRIAQGITAAGMLTIGAAVFSKDRSEPVSVATARELTLKFETEKNYYVSNYPSFRKLLSVPLPSSTKNNIPYNSRPDIFGAHSLMLVGEISRACSLPDMELRNAAVKALQQRIHNFNQVAYISLPSDRNKEPYSDSLPENQKLRRQWSTVSAILTGVARMIDRDKPFRRVSEDIPLEIVPRLDNGERRQNCERALNDVLQRTSEIIVLSKALLAQNTDTAALKTAQLR